MVRLQVCAIILDWVSQIPESCAKLRREKHAILFAFLSLTSQFWHLSHSSVSRWWVGVGPRLRRQPRHQQCSLKTMVIVVAYYNREFSCQPVQIWGNDQNKTVRMSCWARNYQKVWQTKSENLVKAIRKGVCGENEGIFWQMGSIRPGYGVWVSRCARTFKKCQSIWLWLAKKASQEAGPTPESMQQSVSQYNLSKEHDNHSFWLLEVHTLVNLSPSQTSQIKYSHIICEGCWSSIPSIAGCQHWIHAKPFVQGHTVRSLRSAASNYNLLAAMQAVQGEAIAAVKAG